MMRDIADYLAIGFLVGLGFFGIMHFTKDESEPVEEIETVIVRIMDKNNVIHSREGIVQDGEVKVNLN